MDGESQQSKAASDGLGYRCPGEASPISKSLHLARLASGYESCSGCEHRCETGTLPQDVVKNAKRTDERGASTTQLSDIQHDSIGIRGLYLNALTRPGISQLVDHVLDLISQQQRCSPSHHKEFTGFPVLAQSNSALQVLVGYDWRPSSPDLAVGMVSTLKRSGCEIIDVGQVSRAGFDFAVSHIQVDSGLFITGGRDPEGVNGIDILNADGKEWTPLELKMLLERMGSPASRSHRHSGNYQRISFLNHYEKHVRQIFESCKPVRIALACGDPLAMQILGTVLIELGCEVLFLDLNFSAADFLPQVENFRRDIRDAHVDVGFLVRQDSQTVHLFDERGHAIAPDRLMIHFSRYDEEIEYDETGRFWFANMNPKCDAINVIARTLRVMSSSSLPISSLGKTLPRP